MKMGKGLYFSLRAFARTTLREEEENLLKRLDENRRIDTHLRQLENKAAQVAVFVAFSWGGSWKAPGYILWSVSLAF